jgi:hypothetical protein
MTRGQAAVIALVLGILPATSSNEALGTELES